MHTNNISAPLEAQDFEPVGGLERLREAGVDLTPERIDQQRRARDDHRYSGAPAFYVWPIKNDLGGRHLSSFGQCPLCGRLHGHFLSADPYRVPECSDKLPPFAGGREKPPLVKVLAILDVPPADLLLEYHAERPDMLTAIVLAGGYRPSNRWGKHGAGRRITPELARFFFETLAGSAIFDERHAVMVEDGGADAPAALRSLIARYVLAVPVLHSGRHLRMRQRLTLALRKAYRAAGRGDAV